jgi:hypothetical protein
MRPHQNTVHIIHTPVDNLRDVRCSYVTNNGSHSQIHIVVCPTSRTIQKTSPQPNEQSTEGNQQNIEGLAVARNRDCK